MDYFKVKRIYTALVRLKAVLFYGLSLPERGIRVLSAAVGGISKVLTDTMIPRVIRKSTLYHHLIATTQQLLIEDVGGVKLRGGKLPDKLLARKFAGNVAEAAGILAFRFSPLWFFALMGDVAGGTKVYLRRVISELKRDGALPRRAQIHSAEKLLDALCEAGRQSATPIDLPPLSKKELRSLLAEIGESYAKVYRASKNQLPSLESLWKGLQWVRRQEKLPLLQLSGALAIAAAKSTAKAAGELLYEKTVLSYAASITVVRREGFSRFFGRQGKPYFRAIRNAFALRRRTSTEKLLFNLSPEPRAQTSRKKRRRLTRRGSIPSR